MHRKGLPKRQGFQLDCRCVPTHVVSVQQIYSPFLIKLVWNKKINPGNVFDLTLPLDQVAESYRAMDERRAIKTLLRPTP